MINFRCQQCDCNTYKPVIRENDKVIEVETAEDKIMKLLNSGKNTREISEITGLPLQNVNGLIRAKVFEEVRKIK